MLAVEKQRKLFVVEAWMEFAPASPVAQDGPDVEYLGSYPVEAYDKVNAEELAAEMFPELSFSGVCLEAKVA